MSYHSPTQEERDAMFWAKVQKTDGCWIWTGAKTPKMGYGLFIVGRASHFKKHIVRAHRYSYERLVGPIPDDLCVLHHCDNPACVRPDHLFLGTKADNYRDMERKGRRRYPCSKRPKMKCDYQWGEKHHHARYTAEIIRGVRADRAAGMMYKDIGAKYGMTGENASMIAKRKAWAHIP